MHSFKPASVFEEDNIRNQWFRVKHGVRLTVDDLIHNTHSSFVCSSINVLCGGIIYTIYILF